MNGSHVFHEIYLHINWHVKRNRPTLKDDVEKLAHHFIAERCRKTKGVFLHAIGGTDDHVHIAINIEPHVVISDLIRTLKAGSSHDVNEQLRKKELYWQRGYGIVSFGQKNFPWVVEYIRHQREHHAAGTDQSRLEFHDLGNDQLEEDAD